MNEPCGAPTASSEVLIVGGGPAGAALAIALSRVGLEPVTLLDLPPSGAFRIGESVAPSISPLLRRLGLLDDLTELGHHPYHGNRSLWGGVVSVDDFLHRGLGHGWHINRSAFDEWLRDAAVSHGTRLLSPARLKAVAPRPGGGWNLRLIYAGRIVEHISRFVVDASGRRAALATRLGVQRRRCDGMLAIATLVQTSEVGLGTLSLVEATADGWWYAASLPNGMVLVSLMTDHDIARIQSLVGSETFHKAWANTLELANLVPPPSGLPVPSVFPAHTLYSERAAGRGWLSIGDALLALDPLSSSGITGALEDACAAAETIRAWLGSVRETDRIAAATSYARRADRTLRRYLTERRRLYAAEVRWTERPFWERRARPSSMTG
jgi:2-polyprenyl-6-methoxyphenol hydroxylase-like FAD-dependent oxidoreductase